MDPKDLDYCAREGEEIVCYLQTLIIHESFLSTLREIKVFNEVEDGEKSCFDKNFYNTRVELVFLSKMCFMRRNLCDGRWKVPANTASPNTIPYSRKS